MSDMDQSNRPVLPTLVIAGRPNVGKSSLFNRILKQRLAIEARESGVTRDRVSAVTAYREKQFTVVDTGGLALFEHQKSDNHFDGLIREQLLSALESADAAVLVVDVTAGVLELDREVASVLRASGCRVVIAVNKADNADLVRQADGFRELGFDRVVPISCLHKTGLDDLLDVATEAFPTVSYQAAENAINIAIVGRPNVGKSSIVNRMLGANRVIVSNIAGTTRDTIDVPFAFTVDGVEMQANLIDTAGLRKRGKVSDVVEHFSAERAQQAVKRADVVLICLDGTQPVSAQDKHICRMVADAGKASVILVNKWDEACKEMKQRELLERISHDLAFMDYAPTQTCCALSGYNFQTILPTVVHLYNQLRIDISTSIVNQVIKDAMVRMPAPSAGSGVFKVFYGVYKGSNPPTFLLFANKAQGCPDHYRAYLRNQFRRAFGFEGLPVVVEIRSHHPEEKNQERYRQIRKGLQARPQKRQSRAKRRKPR